MLRRAVALAALAAFLLAAAWQPAHAAPGPSASKADGLKAKGGRLKKK